MQYSTGMMVGGYEQRFCLEAHGTGEGENRDGGLADDVQVMAVVIKANYYNTYSLSNYALRGFIDKKNFGSNKNVPILE